MKNISIIALTLLTITQARATSIVCGNETIECRFSDPNDGCACPETESEKFVVTYTNDQSGWNALEYCYGDFESIFSKESQAFRAKASAECRPPQKASLLELPNVHQDCQIQRGPHYSIQIVGNFKCE